MMSRPDHTEKVEVNRDTQAKHRRESILQIYMPVILGAILFVVGAVFVGWGGAADVSRWADTSVIWLLAPLLLLSLIPLAILIAVIIGLVRLSRVLPPYLFRVQKWASKVEHGVHKGCDMLVEPFILGKSIRASIRAFFGRLGKPSS
ncbi:MAG: hypothetical protein AB1345_08140 [Chloroflexota bacterium]